MIAESYYWKDDLLKQARSLRARKNQKRWPDVSFARFEQTIMLGFYSIRKLIEASKLSNSTNDRAVKVVSYPWTGKAVTLMNRHHIDRHYDLESPTEETHDLLFICHQIVHSFAFAPSFNENVLLNGILFTSDRYRHNKLHHADIDVIIELFEHVGRDYPNTMSMEFNPDRQDYDVTAEMTPDAKWST